MYLLQSVHKTKISDERTNEILSNLVSKEFHSKETNMERSFELLCLAYHLKLKCFDDLFTSYEIEFVES